MKDFAKSRREFLKTTGVTAGAFLLSPRGILARTEEPIPHSQSAVSPNESAGADYTLRIETTPVEIAPKRILHHYLQRTIPWAIASVQRRSASYC
jgi:hypothetical protein